MDGLKLQRWKDSFNREAKHLQPEIDGFFKDRQIEDFFELSIDKETESLTFEITDTTLPNDIKRRLLKLFLELKPEDSI